MTPETTDPRIAELRRELKDKLEVYAAASREPLTLRRVVAQQQCLEFLADMFKDAFSSLQQRVEALTHEEARWNRHFLASEKERREVEQRLEAAERELIECRRGRVGDAEIIGRHLSAKEAAEATIARLRSVNTRWEKRNDHYDPDETEEQVEFWRGVRSVTSDIDAALASAPLASRLRT